MGDGAKLGGGAAVGAGGILAVILKSGSAEVHGVEAAARAARAAHAAEEAALIGARGGAAAGGAGVTAGRGAGIALHAGEAAIPAERAALIGASDLRPFEPGLAHAAEEGATVTAQGAATAGKNAGNAGKSAPMAGGATPGLSPHVPQPGAVIAKNAGAVDLASRSARSLRVRKALSNAEPGDVVSLLDHLMSTWDLTQKLGADPEDGSDLDDDVDQKFKTAGLDFRADIVPSVKGVPLEGLDGAKRTLLTDGRSLVPAARLDKAPAGTKLLDSDARSDLLSTFLLSKDAGYAVYVEQPLPPGIVTNTATGWTLLSSLLTSSALDWEEVPTKDLRLVPRVVVSGSKRLVAMVAGPTRPSVAPAHVVFVTVRSATPTSAGDRDR